MQVIQITTVCTFALEAMEMDLFLRSPASRSDEYNECRGKDITFTRL
jgi:hypothetical protein